MIQVITFKHQASERSEVGAVVRVEVDDVKSSKAQLKPGEKLAMDYQGELISLLIYGQRGSVQMGDLTHDLANGPVQWLRGDAFARELPAGAIVIQNTTQEPVVVTYCLGSALPVSVIGEVAPTGDEVLSQGDDGSSVATTSDGEKSSKGRKKS